MGPIMLHEQLGAMPGWEWKRETPPFDSSASSVHLFRPADPTNEERRRTKAAPGCPVDGLGGSRNFGGISMRLYWNEATALDSFQLVGML
jgi:hypothetical protein